MGIKYIDSKRLRRLLLSGAIWVKKYEDYLNELNVYPVPDGDTGSNMSMTLETMKDNLENSTTKKSSMQEVIDVVEEAVLMGARGNSGTILSQIINGFLKGIGNKKRLEIEDLVIALKSSKEVAYQAVETPVEGTILTVIREVSERAEEIKNTSSSLDVFLADLTTCAKEAVDKTPDLLPKLKEAGVVDSGAMGLYYFFEGMNKALSELEIINNIETEEKNFESKINDITHDPAEIKFKYCTEFIIRNNDFDTDKFKEDVLKLGDSAVFAQTSKKFKIHIHTNNPGQALELAVKYGDLEKIKIENMKLQNEGLISSEKDQSKIYVNHKSNYSNYSYIVLSDSNNLKDEFLNLGADVVIIGGQSQNPSVQDMLNAIAKVNTNKTIIILPNNKNVISTANIARDKTEKNIVVLPTKTMLEGYFYLKNYFENIENLKNEEKLNYSIEITKAVRDTTVDDLSINKGDYIALVNTKIKHCNSNLEVLIDEIVENYTKDKLDNITIVEGYNKEIDITRKFSRFSKVKYINGEQENYNYYIYIENRDKNMPEIAIVTDSSSDLTLQDTKGLPIYITPIRLEADGQKYRDSVTISKEEFLNKLINENAVFKSAQPSPKELMSLFTYLLEKGYKKILTLNISSSLSGTLQTTKMVINNLNKNNEIIPFDTKQVSLPLGLLVKNAAELSIKGKNIQEIIRESEKLSNKMKTLIVVDDLKYLERGGRISKTSKSIGDFLNLKPIITIFQGSLKAEKKVLGSSLALSYVKKTIEEYSKKHSINLYPAWAGTNKEKDNIDSILEYVKNNYKVTLPQDPVILGPTVVTHAGPIYAICIVPKLL